MNDLFGTVKVHWETLISHFPLFEPQTLEANLAVPKEKFGDQSDTDITSDDYIDFEIEVITSHGKLTKKFLLK